MGKDSCRVQILRPGDKEKEFHPAGHAEFFFKNCRKLLKKYFPLVSVYKKTEHL